MNLTNDQLEGLSIALEESNLLEICVDPILWRATIGLEVLTLPKDDLPPKDRIVHIVLNRIVRLAASLANTTDAGNKRLKILPFTIDQLDEVVKSFERLSIYGADFFQANNINALPKWFNYKSLDIQNEFGNNKTYTLDLFQIGNNRRLDVRFWFHELRIEKNGKPLDMEEFIEGGKRWWEAFNKNSFRTEGSGMFPLKPDPPKGK